MDVVVTRAYLVAWTLLLATNAGSVSKQLLLNFHINPRVPVLGAEDQVE